MELAAVLLMVCKVLFKVDALFDLCGVTIAADDTPFSSGKVAFVEDYCVCFNRVDVLKS